MSDLTLSEAVELFLDGYIETTRRSYAVPLKQMVNWLGPVRPVDVVRAIELDSYAKRGLRDPDRNLAEATVQKHIKTMRTFWNWCVEVELVERSPFKVKGKRLKRKISSDGVMKEWELMQLLEYARWRPRLYALVLFLADTGCRRGGAAGLRVDDLDLQNRKAVVTEKGDKTRPVFYDDVTTQALRDWLSRRGNVIGGYVFSTDGKPITSAALGQFFRRGCIAAGIGSYGPHTLRHRKGHQLARTPGVDVATAANILGHEDVKITLDYYYNADWAMAEEAVRRTAIKDDPTGKVRKFTG
jgi:integrase